MTKQKQGQSDRFLDPNTDYLHTAFLHDLNLFKHISGYLELQSSNLYFIYIIRFVFSLAFQPIIQSVLLQKLSKIRRKENGFSSRFGFNQTYFAISRAVVVRFLFHFYHQIRLFISFPIVLLQKLAKIWRKENEKQKA